MDVVGLIPAAGSGTRLYPFSRAVPKELYPVLGKATIEHCVENLREGGIRKIYMVVGHQKGALMDYIGDGSFFGVETAYIYQLRRRGLGHAILQARNWIDTTFVTLFGDSFIEPKSEIRDLIRLHQQHRPIATLLVFAVDDPTGYGIVTFADLQNGHGILTRLIEKPDVQQAERLKTGDKYYGITGACVFEPKIFDYLRMTKPGINNEIQLTDAIALALKHGEKVIGVVLQGKYIDIGKWRTVFDIEKDLLSSADIAAQIREREAIADRIKRIEKDNSEGE